MRSKLAVLAALLLAVGVVGPAPFALAATINVTTTSDAAALADGSCALREAIRSANTDTAIGDCLAGSGADTILVPPGTYTLTVGPQSEELAAGGDLDIRNGDLSIQGAGPGATIVDGGDIDRVFDVRPLGSPLISVSIADLTVRGGKTSGVQGNGGGIQNRAALNLTRVDVTGNEGNSLAGGIENEGAQAVLTIRDSTIGGNTATSDGGGITNEDGGVIQLTGVTLSGNRSNTYGAGVAGFAGTIELTNVTVSGNVSGEEGGGLYVYGFTTEPSAMSLHNVTVTGNSVDEPYTQATHGGGGLRQDGNSTMTLRNSIVAGNTNTGAGAFPSEPDCKGTLTSEGHNVIGDTSGCTVTPGTGDQIGATVDPKLGPLADNGGPTQTRALLSGSPAIDAGGADCAATDQRGVPRKACDVGAYELVRCLGGAVNRVAAPEGGALVGTGGVDVALGQGGKDTIKMLGGKDRVCAGGGGDVIRLGGGKDRALGQGGNDRIIGGGGTDTCQGGPGKRDRTSSCEKGKA